MHADADRLDERGSTPNKTPNRATNKTTGRLSPKVLAIGAAVVLVVIGATWFIFSDKNKVPELFDDPRDQSGLPPIDADPAETVLDAAAPQPLVTDSELAPVERPQALDGSDKQVGQALPQLPKNLLFWRLQFALGATGHALRWAGGGVELPGEFSPPAGVEELIDMVVGFTAAGMEAP